MKKLKLILAIMKGHAVAYNLVTSGTVTAKPYVVPERPLKGAGCVTS